MDLPTRIGKPALRALSAAGYARLDQVVGASDAQLLALHGVGPRAVRILREEIAARRTAPDLFLGTWELVPELSLYEFGPAPAGCVYEIAARDGLIHVHMGWWMEPGGAEQRAAFAAPGDGAPRPLPHADGAGPDAFSLTRVDARTLDSAALRDGRTVAYARRAAAHDGSLLSIVQQGQRPDGGGFRNFQVYRRASPAR